MKYVLIGAGPAGVRAAETLREEDPDASITLVSGERGEPYARMAIPYILSGRITEEGARQRKAVGHFENLGIRYLNNKAMQVHAGADGGTVDLDDGSRLEYDRLLVATGSSPTLPPISGTDLDGVVTCWTLDDARAIAAKLKPRARVVMVGAGFVAGVCMKSLVESGAHLSVIAGRSGQILRSMMTPVGSGILQRWLENNGVNVITKGRIERIDPGPRLVMDTQVLDADLIILATGVRSNVSFLEGTGANLRLTLNPPFFTESNVTYDSTLPGRIATGFTDVIARGDLTGPRSSPTAAPFYQGRAWDLNLRPQMTNQFNFAIERQIDNATNLNVGRSPKDTLRVLDALQTDELCPCNWQKGEAPLKPVIGV